MRQHYALVLVPLSLMSCVTQQRGQIIEARLASLESAGSTERVELIERRTEVLRHAVARLERLQQRLQAKEDALGGAPAKPAPTVGAAIVAGAHEGSTWDTFQRQVASDLVTLYATNQGPANPASLATEDQETGKPLRPRDPGKTGADGENLVGKPLPKTRFLSSTGDTVDVKDYVGKKNVVLVVLRGLDNGRVCLGCSTQTLAISQSLDEFDKRNAAVFLVYPGPSSSVSKFLEAVRDLSGTLSTLSLDILLDVDLSVVKEYRIEGRLAKPTTVIIDKKGIARFAHVGQSRGDRPTVPQMLAVLDQIKAEEK